MTKAEAATLIARRFLDLMENQEIETARTLLAPDFFAIYPGDRRFTTLEDLVESGRRRYREVRKQHEPSLYVPTTADGTETVIFHGRLAGYWADGGRFEGIRFTDRFRLRDSLIIEQQVWNDIGEARLRIAGID